MKKLKITIAIIIVIVAILGISIFCINSDNTELRSIKSQKQLESRWDGSISSTDMFKYIIGMPFSVAFINSNAGIVTKQMSYMNSGTNIMDIMDGVSIGSTTSSASTTTKDYSTTNIQVENVDEADIVKTDGDYIYSISEDNVVITNVKDPQNPTISAKIVETDGIPEDLIIYNGNTLVTILTDTNNSTYNYNTSVKIYDISNKENPKLIKSYKMYEPYYTSRCINNKLYVISSGNLRKENDETIRYYTEDRVEKEIELKDIKYLTDINTISQTIISFVDLDKPTNDVKLSSYLIDVQNSYVSENSIYLLNQKYDSNDTAPIKTLFGIKGIIGPFEWMDENNDYGYYTEIYKFNILDNGEIEYKAKIKIKGKTINQYSIDEYEKNLRIALCDSKQGSRVLVLDENLKEIGTSEYIAKGETMYSSRFVGDKVYLVTYKTIDPLFVIDLSNPKKPEVLGELKIPGYSTYLHPYDENYLIGIGMETEEVVNRNASGKVISETSKIIGMKMALFDVSDVNNPKEISNTIIGDRYTTSAILTNPKALLFSKEKEIIAIPVNNYSQEFEVQISADTYSSIINSYTGKSNSYIAEGYLVYSINPQDGFKLKGTITHENKTSSRKYNSYYYTSKLLRGLYIENDLYTVSENEIKVNKLDTMEQIGNLKIEEETN